MAKRVEERDDAEVLEMQRALAVRIAAHARVTGENTTEISGLLLFRRTSTTPCYRGSYEPSLGVFAQGRKRVNLGGTIYMADRSSFLLSSIDVPVESQIVEASEDVPGAGASAKSAGLAIGTVTVGLLDACLRLIQLLDTPADAPFLGPLIQREIVYRLLCSPQGERLRAIATTGDLSNRTAKAIAWLRANFKKPLHLDELAQVARMGVSTLHHQFRALTSMSPLQYQKHLRLHAAREKMLMEGMDATSAAFDVGYESVSQFNREYSRLFGQPPMRDVRSLRGTDGPALSLG
jgi:AraC-like DNA-binding protein